MPKFNIGDVIIDGDHSSELIIKAVGQYKYTVIVMKDEKYRFTSAKFPNELIDEIDDEFMRKEI